MSQPRPSGLPGSSSISELKHNQGAGAQSGPTAITRVKEAHVHGAQHLPSRRLHVKRKNTQWGEGTKQSAIPERSHPVVTKGGQVTRSTRLSSAAGKGATQHFFKQSREGYRWAQRSRGCRILFTDVAPALLPPG